MLKIGHRGAKGYVSENTLDSFKKALELKVDGIELDVHLSSDAEIMVIHDETINRTTKGNGFVKDFTSVELKQFGIPTLKEVLDVINQECFVNIEIKDAKTTKLVVELIQNYLSKKHWNIEKFIVSSFDWTVLKEISQLNSKIKIGVLTEDTIDDAVIFAKEIKAFSINPYFKLLTINIVERIKKEGFQIHTWTVNSSEDITFVKSLNVDGIISDFPDKNIMNSKYDIIIVGGGAAGFFTAINIVENNPKTKVAILERGQEVLSKVRISGGGRCNVTHACFVPNDLVKFYPRGEKELRGTFHQFCSGDTIDWFEKHGVELKIEDDGRMFPVSNSSQTIIDCFLEATKKLGIDILTGQSVQSIFKSDAFWKVETNHETFACKK